MSGLRAVGILRMFDLTSPPYGVGGEADILFHLSPQRHSQGLDASADAEDGKLAVVGQAGDEQFG